MLEKEPDLLTRKQCQHLLQISKSKMLEFIHDGLIPARKIAGRYKIEKSDLVDFINTLLTETNLLNAKQKSQRCPQHHKGFLFKPETSFNLPVPQPLSAVPPRHPVNNWIPKMLFLL